MIDQKHPDFHNTPGSDQRPSFHYEVAETREPLVSVITPYYNTGPVFWETFYCVQRMSIPYWEWLIVDDDSKDPDSLAQLREAQAREPRIRVIHQANAGPGVARNRAAREARGKYLLILDSDDMVEPTFVEKAIWFLETQPAEFAAIGSRNVTFGSTNILWAHGFDHAEENIYENFMTIQSVVRKDAYLKVGGFDPEASDGHEDWDFWLNLAEAGLWGYMLPEYLTWYRTQSSSRLKEIESDRARSKQFRRWLNKKHAGLAWRFPHPKPLPAGYIPPLERHAHIPVSNPLAKPAGMRRIVLIVPWLQVGGADRFNLDMLERLTGADYEFTVVTTLRDDHPWLSRFTQITPDVFCLHKFINIADYPRFISYLIESRQADAVMVSNSDFGYALLPYLRARHPQVALLDYTHMEEPGTPHDGHPGSSVLARETLDLHVTNTEHLRAWMIERGVDAANIEVRRCAVDMDVWKADAFDRTAVRKKLGLDPDIPVILFVGRIVPQKRPLFLVRILHRLAANGVAYQALIVGHGEQFAAVRGYVRRNRLGKRIHLLGVLPPEKVREIMAASDMFLLPSEQEGIAIVLMEAMAMGLTPVAADVGGQMELVTPDVGYLVRPGGDELKAYINAVTEALSHPERRGERAALARERVAQSFAMASLRVGLDASFSRACAQAARRADAPDIEAACVQVDAAIQQFAHDDRIQAKWARGEDIEVIRRIRRARQRILPQGSRLYELYRSLRMALRTLRSDAAGSSGSGDASGAGSAPLAGR